MGDIEKKGSSTKTVIALAWSRLVRIISTPLGFAAVICFLIIFFLQPGFVLLTHFPLGQTTWELQDPVVSHLTFVPGHRVIRTELLEHQNLLWSNLRSMGVPILGNEIQAAPLFPLTLLLFWMPDQIFWNFFVVFRLVLAGMAAFLFATQIMKFNRLGGIIFTITLVFSTNVLRWMNHPWQNAFAAGLWYLYFFAKMADSSHEKFGKGRILFILGMSVSVYSLVTSGFPEGAAMAGLLTVLVLIVPFTVKLARGELKISSFLFDVILAHFIGFSFSSSQIFAIVEYIKTAVGYFRDQIGLQQFSSLEIFWNLITRFKIPPPEGPIIHFFNLIPLFLFIWGVGSLIRKPKSINRFDIAACVTGMFYILKCFPLWPWFNEIIASLPIFDKSFFTYYFFSLFLWFFAYFCARGGQELFALNNSSEPIFHSRIPKNRVLWVGIVTVMVLILTYYSAKKNSDINPGMIIRVLSIFGIFILFCLDFSYRRPIGKLAISLFAFFIGLLLIEGNITRPHQFLSYSDYDYKLIFRRRYQASKINDWLEANGIRRHEVRDQSSSSDYAGGGIASVDNGAAAILTRRTQALRTTLFKTDWDGYLPIQEQITPYSWHLTSTNLIFMSKDQFAAERNNLEEGENKRFPGKVFGLYLIYDNRTLSRAYTPTKCLISSDLNNSISLLSDQEHFQLGSAVIEDLNPAEQVFCREFSGELQGINILQDEGTKVTLKKIQGPNILILNDSFYPGWKAVDKESNQTIQIKPANINFRALILPENREYTIEFLYQPKWLTLVYALMGSSLLMVAGLGLVAFRKGSSAHLTSQKKVQQFSYWNESIPSR